MPPAWPTGFVSVNMWRSLPTGGSTVSFTLEESADQVAWPVPKKWGPRIRVFDGVRWRLMPVPRTVRIRQMRVLWQNLPEGAVVEPLEWREWIEEGEKPEEEQ